MVNLESLVTVFSGQIQDTDGAAVLQIPEREIELGELEQGETYRVALLPTGQKTGSRETESRSDSQRPSESSGPPVEEGELLEVEIEDLGDQGDGIARVGPGYIVFVPDTKVGDRVTVKITRARENFAFGDIVEDEPITG